MKVAAELIFRMHGLLFLVSFCLGSGSPSVAPVTLWETVHFHPWGPVEPHPAPEPSETSGRSYREMRYD